VFDKLRMLFHISDFSELWLQEIALSGFRDFDKLVPFSISLSYSYSLTNAMFESSFVNPCLINKKEKTS